MGAACFAATGDAATGKGDAKTFHYREKSHSSSHRKGANPFLEKVAAKGKSLRRLRHKLLVQMLYEDRSPSSGLVKRLHAAISGPADVPPLPPAVKNPLGDELQDSIGPIGEGALSFEVSVTPEAEAEDHRGSPRITEAEAEDVPAPSDMTTPKPMIPRQRSRNHLTPQYQAYLDVSKELRGVLQLDRDADVVTFVVGAQSDAQGSVHGQLSAQGCTRANSGLGAVAILQQRNTLNSIMCHNTPSGSPSTSSAPNAPNVCRRTLHISPKCVGFLTNELHMNILRGASDTARILEDIRFVRVADE